MQNSIFDWNHDPVVKGETSLKQYIETVCFSLETGDDMLGNILFHASSILKDAPFCKFYDIGNGYRLEFFANGFATITKKGTS